MHQNDAIQQLLISAICNHVTSTANQNRIYGNLLQDLGQYNWRNSVMDTLVATGLEALDVWSATRGIPKEHLINECANVICDIQSMVSAQRNRAIIETLTPYEQQVFRTIADMGQRLNNEIEAYFAKHQPVLSGYVSPYNAAGRYQQEPVNSRYAKSKPSEIRTPATTSNDNAGNSSARYRTGQTPPAPTVPEIDPNKRHYVKQNKGNSTMSDSETLVYENHRRQIFTHRPADRNVEADFMGALANNGSVDATVKGNNIEAAEITKLATDVVAVCRQHAQAIFCAMIADAGNALSPDAILEYSYDEVRSIYTLADEESLRLTLLNNNALIQLREIKSDLLSLASVLKTLLDDPVNHWANTIGRQLNLAATEQINRFLKFDLDMTWQINDFQAAYPALLTELYAEHGKDIIDPALATVAEDIITKVGLVFTPSLESDPDLCHGLNNIHLSEIATRSLFLLRHVHVTHIPANFARLNLTFESSIALVDPTYSKDLYSALVALETRMEGDMRKYSKILLVTEDEVELEVIPTYLDLADGSDDKQYALKILKTYY